MKLSVLHTYLTQAAHVARPEQLTAELESGEPEGVFRTTGNGLVVYRHQYTGRIVLEHGACDLLHLLALVHVWMEENAGDGDHNRFLGWAGEAVDDRQADIDLRFQFEEEVHYVPAEPEYAGDDKLTWRGTDYKRAAEQVNTAAQLEGDTVTAEIG